MITIPEKYLERMKSLLSDGARVQGLIYRSQSGRDFLPDEDSGEAERWIVSVRNLIENLTTGASPYRHVFVERLDQGNKQVGNADRLRRVFGVLSSLQDEIAHGTLLDIEGPIVAATFDNFLDHAKILIKQKDKIAASVLASVVFEDAIKKIAARNALNEQRTLEPIINDLLKAEILAPLKAKKLKGFVGVRDKALHANWDQIDENDVQQLIAVVDEIIADHFDSDN